MKFRSKVKELKMTCFACPSQWEGIFDDGYSLYVRYRHSCLTVSIEGEVMFSITTNEDDGGVMSTDEMLKLTGLKMSCN